METRPTPQDLMKFKRRSKEMANVMPPQDLCLLYYNGSVESQPMPRSEAYAILRLKIKFEGWLENQAEVVLLGSEPKKMRV